MSFNLSEILAEHDGENFQLQSKYMNPELAKVVKTLGFDRFYVRGEGCYLYDDEGAKYLDLLSGFGVFALGRSHPVVRDALHQALTCGRPALLDVLIDKEVWAPVTNFEAEVYRVDGTTIWIAENARAVRGQDGVVICYEGTVQDITQRKHAEAEVKKLNAHLETRLHRIEPRLCFFAISGHAHSTLVDA